MWEDIWSKQSRIHTWSSLVNHQYQPMENRTDSPIAVKVEKHSQYVVLTYFHGDINSMVDAHFNRALSNAAKAKAPLAKTKKIRKTIKLEKNSPCQESNVDPYSGSQVPPVGLLRTFSPVEDAPDPWNSFSTRTGEGPGLPSLAYSLSSDGLGVTGQQYSLLNLLHNDQGEMGPSIACSSKPELHHSWTVPQEFRDAVEPGVVFEPGRRLDKKDLYWY